MRNIRSTLVCTLVALATAFSVRADTFFLEYFTDITEPLPGGAVVGEHLELSRAVSTNWYTFTNNTFDMLTDGSIGVRFCLRTTNTHYNTLPCAFEVTYILQSDNQGGFMQIGMGPATDNGPWSTAGTPSVDFQRYRHSISEKETKVQINYSTTLQHTGPGGIDPGAEIWTTNRLRMTWTPSNTTMVVELDENYDGLVFFADWTSSNLNCSAYTGNSNNSRLWVAGNCHEFDNFFVLSRAPLTGILVVIR